MGVGPHGRGPGRSVRRPVRAIPRAGPLPQPVLDRLAAGATTAACYPEGMERDTGPRAAGDADPSEDEARVLRFIRLAEQHRPMWRLPAAYTVGRLAGLVGLDVGACCRALYRLVHRGDLQAELLGEDRFRLRTPAGRVRAGRGGEPGWA